MKLVNYLSSNFDADDFHVGQVMSVCPGCLCYIQGGINLRCFYLQLVKESNVVLERWCAKNLPRSLFHHRYPKLSMWLII